MSIVLICGWSVGVLSQHLLIDETTSRFNCAEADDDARFRRVCVSVKFGQLLALRTGAVDP